MVGGLLIVAALVLGSGRGALDGRWSGALALRGLGESATTFTG
jgi:hypothetical protein